MAAAPEKTWSRPLDSVELFLNESSDEWYSEFLFDGYRKAWAHLLKGGTARPTRVPTQIRLRFLTTAPVPSYPGSCFALYAWMTAEMTGGSSSGMDGRCQSTRPLDTHRLAEFEEPRRWLLEARDLRMSCRVLRDHCLENPGAEASGFERSVPPAEVDPGVVLGKIIGVGESSEWPSGQGDWLPTQDGSLIRTCAIIEVRLVEVADEPFVAS